MSQKNLVILQNKETGEVYHTRKNKKLVERKLKYKKFSKKLRKHVWFEEIKKYSKLKKGKAQKSVKSENKSPEKEKVSKSAEPSSEKKETEEKEK